jgi:pimeloyl-ACP methyl ester carboxylesterase
VFSRLFVPVLLGLGLSLPVSVTQVAGDAVEFGPTSSDVSSVHHAPATDYPATAVDCPIEVPAEPEVTCGTLTAPEDHDQPDGPTVRLPYIIVHSTATDPEPEPVVVTSGGPGYSALPSVWAFAQSPLLDHRDIIITEQRGNRYSQPALPCDPLIWWDVAAGTTPCLDSIRSQNIDLSTYTTHSMVQDLIALRQALGYEQWNLYGSSFSTSLMLLLMEADPAGTRSAVLQSVKPPNETTFAHEADSALRAIEHLLRVCDGDDRCRTAFPDLEEQLFAVIRRLNRAPVDVEFQPAGETEPITVQMDGDLFLDWIVISQLYQPAYPPFGTAYIPLLIGDVHGGGTELLAGAAGMFWDGWLNDANWSLGLLFAVNCQQDLPAAGPERPVADLAASDRLDGFLRSSAQRDICTAWKLEPQAAAAEEYVRSDIPALIVAGAFDPITPPQWGRTTAEHLTTATYVEFPGHGHNVGTDNPCAAALEASFVEDPSAPLDTGCVASAPNAEFVTPDDVFFAPGLVRSRRELSIGAPQGVAWLEALAVVSIIGMFGLLAGLLIGGGLWLLRRLQYDDKPVYGTLMGWTGPAGYCLALAVTTTTLAIPVLLTAIADAYPNGNELRALVGPSRDLVAATLAAWTIPLTGLLVIALAALTAWAWTTRRWHGAFPFTTTLVVLFALPMMFLCIRWDLFTMLWRG